VIKAGALTVAPTGPHRDVVPIDDPSHPTLISMRPEDGSDDLSDLVALVPGLCELLTITSYEDAIGRPIEQLIATGVQAPAPADFARVLRLDPARVGEVLSHLGAPIDALIGTIVPVVACLAGVPTGLALLEQRGALDDDAALASVLEELLANTTTVTVSNLMSEAREAGSVDDLRRALGLDFAQFNAALRELGGEYEPIRNEAAHAQALRHYVEVHREELLLALRRRFLAAYRDGRPLDDYVTNRELRALVPDPAWLDHYEIPTDELLATHAAEWIAGLGLRRRCSTIGPPDASRCRPSSPSSRISAYSRREQLARLASSARLPSASSLRHPKS
jgi:hypothetical protein